MMVGKRQFDGERVKLGDVFELRMGKTPSRNNPAYWNNGDYEWVSIKDLGSYGRYVGRTKETISELGRRESGIKPVPANTLLMSFKLSLGKTAITVKETYTNEAIMAFIDKGLYKFDLGYMWHQFRSKDWSAGTNTAVMGKTLNKRTLAAASIWVPDLKEQERISKRLDIVQSQIEIAEGLVASLDALVKSRFVEMFGDPIANPKGIAVKSIGDIADVQTGATPLRGNSAYYGGSIPWVKTGEVAAGLSKKTEETITELALQETNCKLFPAGTILVAMYGQGDTRGKAAILREPAATNQACAAILPCDGCSAGFLLAQLHLRYEDLRSRSLGGNQKNLSLKIIKDYEVIVPPAELQNSFLDFVAKVDKPRFVGLDGLCRLPLRLSSHAMLLCQPAATSLLAAFCAQATPSASLRLAASHAARSRARGAKTFAGLPEGENPAKLEPAVLLLLPCTGPFDEQLPSHKAAQRGRPGTRGGNHEQRDLEQGS